MLGYARVEISQVETKAMVYQTSSAEMKINTWKSKTAR